ncbi:MAG: hypothetical protein ACI4RN_07785, partial [Oscillospiraceae bacterium]
MENPDKINNIKKYCEVLDSLYERSFGRGGSIAVEDETNDIKIVLTCADLQIENKSEDFFVLT